MTTWIEHVKAVYAKGKGGGMSYKAALKAAAKTWKKKGKGASKASKKSEAGGKAAAEEKEEGVVKKNRRRRRKAMPKVPDKDYKNIDSIGMPKKM